MPKAIKKKGVKKDTIGEDINETVQDIREKLKERQRILVYSLLALGALLIIAGGYFVYAKVTAGKAQQLEYEGYKLFYDDSPAPSPDRHKKALEKFKESYAAKKSPIALFYIANCYYELGSYDEAIKTLKELTGKYTDRNIVPLAHYKTAMSYVKKGDMPGALNALNAIISAKDSPLQDMALLESGKILEAAGKPEDAKNKYKELINKFPNSALIDEAKARLGSQ